MTDHDPLCPHAAYDHDRTRCGSCELIAKVRADEREHTAFLHEALLRNQLADLRAKVAALPGKPNGKNWIRRDKVLDLFDGGGDG